MLSNTVAVENEADTNVHLVQGDELDAVSGGNCAIWGIVSIPMKGPGTLSLFVGYTTCGGISLPTVSVSNSKQ